MSSMFETLVNLPLLQGATIESISNILGNCKLNFNKYAPGETIIEAGDTCDNVTFIISGTVRLTAANSDQSFTVSQSLAAPDVIGPEFLFGKHTVFPGIATAIDNVSILRITKSEYIRIINSGPVFLFNYLNLISMDSQNSFEGLLQVSSGDSRLRVAHWVRSLTQAHSFDITLRTKHKNFSTIFCSEDLKEALDDLHQQGLIDYTTNQIKVRDRRALLKLLQ